MGKGSVHASSCIISLITNRMRRRIGAGRLSNFSLIFLNFSSTVRGKSVVVMFCGLRDVW